ncbi:MAG TPA: helix-turn-helix transcriptional regulator [Acidimicrobiales bacterium]|nr:helix-turn-helix transcriptional regulator [Acidimicrobiales bacterium]
MAAAPDLRVAFGQVLREFRMEAGLSQEALSHACGRHRTYVSLIERGRNQPTITTLWKLAEALGVQPSVMIEHVEKVLG